METMDVKMKVVQGHAASISQQMDELTTFISEMSAISTYSERGMTEMKIQPILLEIVNRLNSIKGSVNVILEESAIEEEQKG